MTNVNLYFYIENLNLTQTQKQTLVNQLKIIGLRDSDSNPHNRNHWRIRPDNEAVIFEGWFDDSNLSAIGIRNRLASIFNVNANQITYTTNQTDYGPVVTYSYNSQQKLRCGIFGGLSATWSESHDAVLAFLKQYSSAWEPSV